MASITTAGRNELILLYVSMFNAAPGANNLNTMVVQAESGKSLQSIADSLATTSSTDFNSVYPPLFTADEFAAKLATIMLGSETTTAVSNWAKGIVKGWLTAGWSATKVITTAVQQIEATTSADFVNVKAMLNNKVDVASYYSVTDAQSSTSLATLQSVINGVTSAASTVTAAKTAVDTNMVAASVSTFTLTTGIDTFTGSVGNDKFSATPNDGYDTFTALDALDGGAGNDMLTVAAVGALTIPAGATVTNIETATLASSTSVTADVSTWTGLTSLIVSNGGNGVGAGPTTITAAATTNVTESGSVDVTTITGGKDVTVVHATEGTVNVDQTAGAVKITNNLIGGATNIGVTAAAAANAVKGAVTVAAKGAVNVSGGTTHDITFTESSAYTSRVANTKAAADAATAKTTADTNAATTGTKGAAQLKVDGLAILTAALGAGTPTVATNNAATLAALNGGFITRADKVAIDAAFITSFKVDGVGATASAAALAVETPLVTAAANDVLAKAATATTAATTATNANNLVTLDASTNRLLTDNTNNTALTSVKVTGGYGTSTSLITGTALTTVTLDNAAPATLNSNVLTNVSVSNVVGATGNVTITNATVGHTQNLTLSNVGTAATSSAVAARFAVTDNAATTINLVSNGTTNIVSINPSPGLATATALNLTGAGAFDGVVARVNAKAQVFANSATPTSQANAAAAVAASSALNLATNAVITATGSSGANNVLIGVGQSYLGGSGVDTVTTGATAQTAAVDGGAGTADKLIVTNLTNIGVVADGTGSAKFTGFEVLETRAAAGTINLATTLTGNTLTSVIIAPIAIADGTSSSATISGLNATQANAVTISTAPNSTGYVLGVTGATSVGQLDSVTVSAGAPLGKLSIAGVETLNITPTATTSFNMSSGSAALSAINVTGGSSAVYISGEAVALVPNTVIDASKSTGKAMLNIVSATANGAKLVGSATANNLLTSNGSSSVLVGGAGNDILRGGAGDDTFTAGNGNNTVVTGNGDNTVTLGNGMNLVTGGTGVDTITVGTGTNWITAGGGLDVITLGAHALGNVHTIDLSAVADMAVAGATQVVTINGFVSGVDKINIRGGADFGGGLSLTTATSTQAIMLAPITDTTSVATLANVYTALATALGTTLLFPASADGAAGLVARTVTYTTGAAAGTYLVINNNANAFNGGDDIVIKLASGTVVAAGDIVVGQTAYSVTPIQAFTATVGTDNFVGGDLADTFASTFSGVTLNGGLHVLNTFSAADVMTGGASGPASPLAVDTLTISPAGDTTTGTSANMTLADADFAGKSEIETLTIGSTGVGTQTIVVGTNYSNGFTTMNTSSLTGAISIDANAVTTAGAFNVTTTNSGANVIVTGASAAVVNTITVVVGSKAITGDTAVTSTIAITGGAGADVIKVDSGTTAVQGTGTVAITGGAGGDSVTLGVGTGATTIIYGAASQTFASAITSGTTALNGADVITGLAAADKIDLQALTTAAYVNTIGTTALLTGGTVGDFSLLRGGYVAATKIFTLASGGADSILQWDADGTGAGTVVETIVLVGFTGTATTTTDGLITLG